MKPGVKPKPTALKILEGNPGKRPINENEPKPGEPDLEAPDWLNKEAKEIWNKYAPVLKDLGIFKQTDELALACLCEEAGHYKILQETIKEKGYTTTNIRNGDKAIPELAMARNCLNQVKVLMVEFGLTPSSRTRLNIPDYDPEDDPIERILSGKEF